MRLVVGGMSISSAGSAKQLLADSAGRVLMFTLQAPASNGAVVYWGTSSGITSAGSYILSSNTTYPVSGGVFTFPAGKGIAPASFWMNASTSTTASIRFSMVVEP